MNIVNKKETIKNFVLEKINSGEWSVNTKIFSENQFCDCFHIARGTVRSALSELADEGIIKSVKSKGYFVKKSFRKEEKKYIIVLSSIHNFRGDFTDTKKRYFDLLKKEIEKRGYECLFYINNKILTIEESLGSIVSRIAGIICLQPYAKDLSFFKDADIPIVRTYTYQTGDYPCVYYNGDMVAKSYKHILEKYKAENLLVFSFDYADISHFLDFNNILQNRFSKYNIHAFGMYDRSKNISKQIKNILENTVEVPDGVVFLDDNLFDLGKVYFDEFDRIFANTKIITHFNAHTEYKGKYPLVKIGFDFSELAEKTVSLLIKLIQREFMKKYNYALNPKITDEYSE